MNLDQRSMLINTEIGLIIDSTEIARDIAARFDAMVRPANSYRLVLEKDDYGRQALRWECEENGRMVRFAAEPGVDAAKRTWIEALSLVPIDHLL